MLRLPGTRAFFFLADLIVTAKGIRGGLPLAAVTGTAAIMNSVHGPGGTRRHLRRHTPSNVRGGWPPSRPSTPTTFPWQGGCESKETLEATVAQPAVGGSAVSGEVRRRGAMIAVELVKAGTLHPRSKA